MDGEKVGAWQIHSGAPFYDEFRPHYNGFTYSPPLFLSLSFSREPEIGLSEGERRHRLRRRCDGDDDLEGNLISSGAAAAAPEKAIDIFPSTDTNLARVVREMYD